MLPGTKSILITGIGKEITLDSSSDKMIVTGKNFSIQTNKNGQLVNNSTGSSKEVQINTVVTPPADNTRYTAGWHSGDINAASSIRYPSAFQAGKRDVKITGEVYFEVVQDPESRLL